MPNSHTLQIVTQLYVCDQNDEPVADTYISAEEAIDIANGDIPEHLQEFIDQATEVES